MSNVPAEVLRVAEARRATVAPPPKIRFRYRRADLHIGQQVSAGRLTAKGASLLRRRGYVTVGRWSFEAQGDRGLWECLQQGFTWHQVQRKLAVSVEQSGVTGHHPVGVRGGEQGFPLAAEGSHRIVAVGYCDLRLLADPCRYDESASCLDEIVPGHQHTDWVAVPDTQSSRGVVQGCVDRQGGGGWVLSWLSAGSRNTELSDAIA